MKTSIKSILATGAVALAISTSSVYANVKPTLPVVSAKAVDVSAIKMLVINGDVDVTISQDPKSKVLYTNDGTTDVSVKKIGNALHINSKNYAHGAKITVYVGDIYRIKASGNSVVHTSNLLNVKFLQLYLDGQAKVEINSKTEGLYTSIKDSSELTMKGATDAFNIDMDKTARITLDKFNSKKTDVGATGAFVAARR